MTLVVADEIKASLGKRIRIAREAVGMTQTQLARALKTEQSHISSMERGGENLTIETITAIAEALGAHFSIAFRPAKTPEDT